jgi:tetratricopeptide (TPR) repeat protein
MSLARAAIALFCVVSVVVAQDQPPIVSSDEQAQELAKSLKSKNEASVKQAVDDIGTLFESDPAAATGYFRKYWLDALISSKHFDAAEQLALHGILDAPWRTDDVAFLQETRVRMLCRMDRYKEALSNARSLFNVTSLPNTETALLTLTVCMKAARGEDAKMLREFRKEQIQGAATRPYDQPDPVSPMMAEIPIDPSPYETTIKQITSDDDQSQLAKGNLLLLAGRSDEATKLFEARLKSSNASDRTWLIEDVGRAIRASDGNIGRANQYVITQAAVH